MTKRNTCAFWLGAGCIVLFASHSRAQLSEPDSDGEIGQEQYSGEPTLIVGGPGELIIDASDDHGAIEVADEGMTFDSQDAAIDWAASNMNGEVELDEAGNKLGVFGRLTVYGKLNYGDANTQTSVQVDDYMVAKLGGKTGVVVIAGQPYCLKENGCTAAYNIAAEPEPIAYATVTAPGESTAKCNTDNSFCVGSSSWKKELPFGFFPVYRTIGSDIEQTAGGFQISHHFCWKFIIPWSCSSKSGSNSMRLDNRYRFDTGPIAERKPNVASGVFEQSGVRNNVDAIDIRMWSLFVSIKSNGVPGTGRTAEAELTGVCGVGSSSSETVQALRTSTASGNVDGVCSGVVP